MANFSIAPTQWGKLPDIDDVEPIGDKDVACLQEVYAVLKKHGCDTRFGVAMLHKHFEIANDELLVEETDKENRVLTIKPVKRAYAGPLMETIWQLESDSAGKVMMGCRQFCPTDERNTHLGSRHYKT